jgi:Zn-dependent peptidase ImmA (M78 family)/transcriptional regulator with XRE-family HTH domain
VASPTSVGDRIRALRLAQDLSQAELALRISGGSTDTNSLVSKVETGRQPVDEPTLVAFATALGCSVAFLLRGRLDAVATRPWLRAYADAPARLVESVTADNMLAYEATQILALKLLPDSIPAFDADPNDDHEIERFAQHVRACAGIAEHGVVGNAMRAADRLGCVVLPIPGELGRHLGMSQRIDGVPFIRISRPGENTGGVPGDRQRFTVAHELGHLALHAGCPPPESSDEARRYERQAHRFAGAFLAPAEPLIHDWQDLGGRITLSAFAELKATWGIAIKALVVRFQHLNLINADQATSLYKQISKRGWNKAEPVPTTNEEPVWLIRALEKRLGADPRLMPAVAAEELGLSADHVRRWVDWSPLAADAEIVGLPTGLRGARNNKAQEATIVRLGDRTKRT